MQMLSIRQTLCVSLLAFGASSAAMADDYEGPPFDFADSFYLANGINPATLVGRPAGTGPNSVIDNRENGPKFNNVRVLQQASAYDHSGHAIFFYVTGLPTNASFTNNSAGQRARQIADQYNVYEFPRATNAGLAVFPKRQDLIADLRNGYFSNDPLGIWKINVVKYTPSALTTTTGQQALNAIAARNGRDLDGTPLIRTIDEIESLRQRGFVTIQVPPADGSAGFRWFFCPVIKDPRNGVIAPDALLDVTGEGVIPAAQEFVTLFNCLKTTGRDDCSGTRRRSDCNGDGSVGIDDVFVFLNDFFVTSTRADFDSSGAVEIDDVFIFLNAWFAGV
jgi:hypothetical protein